LGLRKFLRVKLRRWKLWRWWMRRMQRINRPRSRTLTNQDGSLRIYTSRGAPLVNEHGLGRDVAVRAHARRRGGMRDGKVSSPHETWATPSSGVLIRCPKRVGCMSVARQLGVD